MKTHIWNCTPAFPTKVNFIDSNNVLLGYDLQQSCCEDAFWTIGEAKDGKDPLYKGDEREPKEISLDGYVFDPEFFEKSDNGENYRDLEDKYVAIFKLKYPARRDKKPDLYLRLENHHNGYYAHGFVFRADKTIKSTL